jgi:hypothetical protein
VSVATREAAALPGSPVGFISIEPGAGAAGLGTGMGIGGIGDCDCACATVTASAARDVTSSFLMVNLRQVSGVY